MKSIALVTATVLLATTSAIAHDAKPKGKAATAKQSQIVASELRRMIQSLGEQGIKAQSFNARIDMRATDLNPENCCTIITPDEVWTECPCSE